jgi:hypothetical protein
MLLRKSISSGMYRTPFEINSRQCSCCLVIPHELRPVVVGQKISYLCPNCFARYNSGQTVVPLKNGAK